MFLTECLQATCDDLHGEQWEELPNLVLNSLENCELLLEGEDSIFIEDHSEDVPPLNNGNDLLNHVFRCSVQYHLEKASIVVKLCVKVQKRNDK